MAESYSSQMRLEMAKARQSIEASRKAMESKNMKDSIQSNINTLDNALNGINGVSNRPAAAVLEKHFDKSTTFTPKSKDENTEDLLNQIGLVSKRKEGR